MFRLLHRAITIAVLAVLVALTFGGGGALAQSGTSPDLCPDRSPPGWAPPPGSLESGESLSHGESLTSPDGSHRLLFRADGNLVLARNVDGGWVNQWSSGARGQLADQVVMQTDGNLVMYWNRTGNDNLRRAIWASATSYMAPKGQHGAYLTVQNNGFATVSAGGATLWSVGTLYVPERPWVTHTRLKSGGVLVPGDALTSPSGVSRLVFQLDGNLSLLRFGTNPSQVSVQWTSNTAGKGGSVVVMQRDGNMVMYRVPRPGAGTPKPWTAIWASGTSSSPGAAFLAVQDDGRAAIVSGSDELWTVGTPLPPPPPPPRPWVAYTALEAGETPLALGQSVISPDGCQKLEFQQNGNLVLKRGNKVLWSTGTAYAGGEQLAMGSDGQLVMYHVDPGAPDGEWEVVWTSGTSSSGKNMFLAVQDDGRAAIISDGKELWSVGGIPVAG